ncbi:MULTISPECIES: hypothetical protein [unclassified Streptomyces]|uniref:hypothetical protein n=1 Tax=unclassified Streptomyces TaxID=2593676 RepID=UPI0033A8EF07
MNGLYALKPWYADRLSGVRATLVRREVSPDTLTAAGVASAAGAAAFPPRSAAACGGASRFGLLMRRHRRQYGRYLVLLGGGFATGLPLIVHSWN